MGTFCIVHLENNFFFDKELITSKVKHSQLPKPLSLLTPILLLLLIRNSPSFGKLSKLSWSHTISLWSLTGSPLFWKFIWNPFRVSFDNFSHFLEVIDYVMDAVFVVDIILNFFFAFNRRTKIVKDFKSIAIHYVLTQLWVDLISIFPYYWLNNPRSTYFLRYFRFLQSFKSQEQLKSFYESVIIIQLFPLKNVNRSSC